jgi:hypothetical protein
MPNRQLSKETPVRNEITKHRNGMKNCTDKVKRNMLLLETKVVRMGGMGY